MKVSVRFKRALFLVLPVIAGAIAVATEASAWAIVSALAGGAMLAWFYNVQDNSGFKMVFILTGSAALMFGAFMTDKLGRVEPGAYAIGAVIGFAAAFLTVAMNQK